MRLLLCVGAATAWCPPHVRTRVVAWRVAAQRIDIESQFVDEDAILAATRERLSFPIAPDALIDRCKDARARRGSDGVEPRRRRVTLIRVGCTATIRDSARRVRIAIWKQVAASPQTRSATRLGARRRTAPLAATLL